MCNFKKMSIDELKELDERLHEELGLREAGEGPSYKKPRRSVRLVPRDLRVREHLKVARALSTRQIARLLFPSFDPKTGEFLGPGVANAEKRLYDLASKARLVNGVPGELTPAPGYPGTNTAWELTREAFKSIRDDPGDEYPDPLRGDKLKHLVAVNEVYVLLHELLGEIPGYDPTLWRWIGEPKCHRPYGGAPGSHGGRGRIGYAGGHVLKPDAQIVLFDDTVVFLERQTADARKKPEAIHDKVFNYHRYENSRERRADGRPMTLLWACDAERDKTYAMQAEKTHPTKTPRQSGMEERWDKRMVVGAGSPLWVAKKIRNAVAERLAARAS
ncbi:MAG: replication-relaxation family protein [Actinomycetota bacterium]|nr:replication-relaxation family protein [Actinomycetota bacterium]